MRNTPKERRSKKEPVTRKNPSANLEHTGRRTNRNYALKRLRHQQQILTTLDKKNHFVDSWKVPCPIHAGFRGIRPEKLSTK
jgi:hypothetical protein